MRFRNYGKMGKNKNKNLNTIVKLTQIALDLKEGKKPTARSSSPYRESSGGEKDTETIEDGALVIHVHDDIQEDFNVSTSVLSEPA